MVLDMRKRDVDGIPDGEDTVQLSARVPESVRRELKVIAATDGRTLNAVMVDAFADLIQQWKGARLNMEA